MTSGREVTRRRFLTTAAGLRCEDERPDPLHLRGHALQGVTVGVRGYCHDRQTDIPNYFAYAQQFVLCDNYFAEILGVLSQ